MKRPQTTRAGRDLRAAATADTPKTPLDWRTIADSHTRLYQIDFSSPTTGRVGRDIVLALHAAHAMRVLQRRCETFEHPTNLADFLQDVEIARLSKDDDWTRAAETDAERLARYVEAGRIWMGDPLS